MYCNYHYKYALFLFIHIIFILFGFYKKNKLNFMYASSSQINYIFFFNALEINQFKHTTYV